jgi:hypothetical protein
MNDAPHLYDLGSKTMSSCSLTHETRDEARRSWMCAECLRPKPYVRSVDVWIQDRRPADKPMNFVTGAGPPIVHRELLEVIGADIVGRDLYIGRVFGKGGKEIRDWVTARGRRRVILRGTTGAGYRLCPMCGRTLYSATGAPYLYPAPPADATVFESDLFGIVVPHEIYERAAAKKWRRLDITKLPILDPPPDGLGVLPDC